MNILSNEIKKYPYTYIENIIFKKDMDERSLESIMYNYAPFLFTEYATENLNNSISYDKNSEVKFLYDISKIYKFFNTAKESTISDSKKFIVDILRNLPSKSESITYTTIVKGVCENVLENIKKYQYENKLLESALLNSSPIVPYAGTLKQPNMTESYMSEKDIDRQNANADAVSTLLNKSDVEIRSFIKDTFVQNIFDIIPNSNKFIKNDNYNKEYNIEDADTTTQNDRLLPSDIVSLLISSSKYDISVVYFIITYIYYSFKREEYPSVINKIAMLSNTLSSNKSSVQSAMEAMSYFNLPSIDDSILDIDVTENMEYENDRKLSKLMDMSDVNYNDFQTKNYNLDKLLGYLYNARRFKSNSYTNSLFLNDNNIIEGFSYVKNGEDEILICEIDRQKLVIPVMDLSDNYRMKLVSMTKDGNIEVSTHFKTT